MKIDTLQFYVLLFTRKQFGINLESQKKTFFVQNSSISRRTHFFTHRMNQFAARSQCATCVYGDKIVVMGGCDAWDCTNSVEAYSPELDQWTMLPPLGTARRGAGSAVFKGFYRIHCDVESSLFTLFANYFCRFTCNIK